MSTTTNFYGPDSPEIGDVVLVEVVESDDASDNLAVQLLEYGNMRGSIHIQEVSAPRKKSSRVKHQVGKRFAAQVIRIDANEDGKVFMDLSKKAIDYPDKIDACLLRHKKSVVLNRILSDCAKTCSVSVDAVIKRVAWPHYDERHHALDNLLALCSCQQPPRCLTRACDGLSPQLAPAIHKALRGLHRLCRDMDESAATAAGGEADLLDRITEGATAGSPVAISEGAMDDEVKALLLEGLHKMDVFDVGDVRDMVRVQLVALCHQYGMCAYDILGHVVGCIVDGAMAVACADLTLHRVTDSPCIPAYDLAPREWTPAVAKTFLAEFKRLMTIWAPLLRQLSDRHKIDLVPGRPGISRGEFELLGCLAEFCMQDFALALPGFFQDVVFVVYHDRKIDLVDEDTILVWEAYVRDKAVADDDRTRQLLQDIAPLTAWLAEPN